MIKLYQVKGLQELYETIKKLSLPLTVAYKFTKIFSAMQSEVDFLQEQFQKIIEEYAEKDAQNNFIFTENQLGIQIQAGKEKECNEKILALHNMSIETPNIKFQLDELSDLNLTIEQIHFLLPFIEENKDV